MANGRINVEPLPLRLFSGDDQIDVVTAAQTMIRDRQQAVCVGRQIDTHDIGFLVCHMIDEARILVRKAVVILAPDVRGEQIVQRCDRLAPGDLLADLEPFCIPRLRCEPLAAARQNGAKARSKSNQHLLPPSVRYSVPISRLFSDVILGVIRVKLLAFRSSDPVLQALGRARLVRVLVMEF